MTIVDKQHAAQFVNDKGKTYNFDAAECLINYLNGIDEENIGML
jgi:copper chaperone NosL